MAKERQLMDSSASRRVLDARAWLSRHGWVSRDGQWMRSLDIGCVTLVEPDHGERWLASVEEMPTLASALGETPCEALCALSSVLRLVSRSAFESAEHLLRVMR